MSDVALVIDTRAPKYRPRLVGGGLDGPDVEHRSTPRPDKRSRRLAVARPRRPPDLELVAEPELASVTSAVAQTTDPPQTEPEPVAVTPPAYDPPPTPKVVATDWIAARLHQLVPAPADATIDDMLRLLALKLDGYQDCHRLIHPAPGTLDLLKVRVRCLELIDTLPRAERQAVIGLLASDVGGER